MKNESKTENKSKYLKFILLIIVVLCLIVVIFNLKVPKETVVSTESSLDKAVLVRSYTIPAGVSNELRSFPFFAKEGQTAKLSFRVIGQLQNFDVKIGQFVKKDEVVATLDQRDYKLAVERIEQSILEAEAGLKAMKTGARAEDIASLESQLAAAVSHLEQSEKQYQRMENLKKDGVASDVQFDVAKTARDAAKSTKESLENQLAKAKTGSREEEIEMMEAKIAGLNIDLKLAKNKLGDTELKAPFDGIIAEKYFDNHEVIAPGVALLSLVDANNIEATLSVPEDIIRKQDKIGKIECSFESLPGQSFEASIKEVGSSVQKGNLAYPLTIQIKKWPTSEKRPKENDSSDNNDSPQFESEPLTLAVDQDNQSGTTSSDNLGNSEDLKNIILSGMVGTATLELTGDENQISIPTSALFSEVDNNHQSFVWLIDSETLTIKRQNVETGLFHNNGVQILSGLKPGDQIISVGARFLNEGQKVRFE
ncbi:MAG: HlyD family efflux transporter periplasmic adaptor subunit [Planctomycetia bacterium]|nr:HlyD family efflux transporter periplasmic adaptor subunit [Planctomycetia bacterium]